MKRNRLLVGTLIKDIFVAIELVLLIIASIVVFSNDGTSPWGYWGVVAINLTGWGPIILYVIASSIFCVYNTKIVLKRCHTAESIKKYHKLSLGYFISGIIIGSLYGFLITPIFLLENVFLLIGYSKELVNLTTP